MIVIADSTLGGYYSGDPFDFPRELDQAVIFPDLSSARKKAKTLARENQDAYFIVDTSRSSEWPYGYSEQVLEQVDS